MSGSTPVRHRRALVRHWPAMAGVVFAGGLAVALVVGVADTAAASQVLTAAGFVYLGAAAIARRASAWPLFAITFVIIGIGFAVPAFDPVMVMLASAAALAVFGLFRGRGRPPWGLPVQAAALLVIATVVCSASLVPQPWAGVLVGAGLLAHAAWDVHHLRTERVVASSLAEFCAALDLALALVVVGFAVAG
jgi:hypothetical protein